MDEQTERARAEELQKFAEEAIAGTSEDPTKQMYFQRTDTGWLVKTTEEHERCTKQRIRLNIVSYSRAADLLAKEEADKRRVAKKKKARKIARKQRIQNLRRSARRR